MNCHHCNKKIAKKDIHDDYYTCNRCLNDFDIKTGENIICKCLNCMIHEKKYPT